MLNPLSRLSIVALVIALFANQPANAQNPILDQFYGAGLHQFYGGNLRQAVVEFDEAAKAGSKDPRVYYFRGLAELRLGKPSAADKDLQRGAELESADINQFFPVSKSLERVQGSARLYLEKFRVKARAAAYVRQEQRNAIRYEQQRRAEEEVLRNPPAAPTPPAPAPVPPAKAPAPPAPAEEENPFSDEGADAGEATADPVENTDAPAEETEMPAEDPTAAEVDAPPDPGADEESPFDESEEETP